MCVVTRATVRTRLLNTGRRDERNSTATSVQTVQRFQSIQRIRRIREVKPPPPPLLQNKNIVGVATRRNGNKTVSKVQLFKAKPASAPPVFKSKWCEKWLNIKAAIKDSGLLTLQTTAYMFWEDSDVKISLMIAKRVKGRK